MKKKLFILIMPIALLVFAIALAGCGTDNQANEQTEQAANNDGCLSCHSDHDYLLTQAEAKVEKLKAEGKDKDSHGEPITADLLATNVLVSDEYLNSTHGKQSCVSCHNGDENAKDKDAAHAEASNFIADPTADGGSVCAACHEKIVTNFETSLHFTQSGIKNGLLTRLGATPDAEAITNKVFDARCSTCHATCGQCHVSKPKVSGNGLLDGHEFVAKATTENTCAPCHHTTGPEYMNKDVHFQKGLQCLDCHKNADEMHGHGQLENSMKEEHVITASCNDCHKDTQKANSAHQVHGDKLDCYSCHAQPYPNCMGCHNGEAELEEDAFKLGVNENGIIQPFVHNPPSTDMYASYGIELKWEDIDDKSLWTPYSPHTITKTPVIKEGAKKVCENCHNNPDMFLQEKDLDTEAGKKYLLKNLPK